MNLRRRSLKLQYFADNRVMLQNIAVAPRKGARIEISWSRRDRRRRRRSPQGERGLKFDGRVVHAARTTSLPARGARIEINGYVLLSNLHEVAPRKGARIEIPSIKEPRRTSSMSLPARGARIEISSSSLAKSV